MAPVKAFRMRRLFTVLSITGGYCELNCSHCRAKYIRSMLPAPGPRLPRILDALARRGVRGLLVSGGWRRDGTLPVEPYLDALHEAKKRHRLVYNVHLGLHTSRELLARAKEVFDVVDYEFTLSKWLAHEVRRLPRGPRLYLEALDVMLDAGLHVVPHVFLWHPASSLELLREELRALEDRGLREVNLLVYIPPEGDIDSATAAKLPDLLRQARSLWPHRLYLGCMRPRSARATLDPVAIDEGLVERIANPSLKTTKLYKDKLVFYDACCSLPEQVLPSFGPVEGGRDGSRAGIRTPVTGARAPHP